MTYLVAFDGRARSEAALRRAAACATRNDERLVVVSVLPTDDAFAETYGLADGGEYDPEAAAERLHAVVGDVAPDAEFHTEHVDAYAGKRRIAERIARTAREEAADVVLLGSDDAGRVLRSITSVDDADDVEPAFDVFVVRT
jgi:nucleotide-binding universal stress UspA family protein